MKSKHALIIFFCLIFSSVNGNIKSHEMPVYNTQNPETCYDHGIEVLQKGDFVQAANQFNFLATNYPMTPLGQEAYYYVGICYYNLEEFDVANNAFDAYLQRSTNPEHFIDTIEYKFSIAEQFRFGARRRVGGGGNNKLKLPKWQSGRTLAVTIYDEIVAIVPNHDLAAQSLFSKALLLWKLSQYRDSVDTLNLFCKRFPMHELTPEAYMTIAKVYHEQSRYEYQNPDILAFSDLNARRFEEHFPRDERVHEVKDIVYQIREEYAGGLCETGKFFERTGKREASILYYQSAINQFPDTSVSQWCRKRLSFIAPNLKEDVGEEFSFEESQS